MASKSVVLPAPAGPWMRKRSVAPRAVKSIRWARAYGPKASISSDRGLIGSRGPILATERLERLTEHGAVIGSGRSARDALEEAVEERVVVAPRLVDAT